MIVLHRFNGEEFVLNVDQIEIIEEKPDTIITLTNDKKYLVKEGMKEVVDKAMEYHRAVLSLDKLKNNLK